MKELTWNLLIACTLKRIKSNSTDVCLSKLNGAWVWFTLNNELLKTIWFHLEGELSQETITFIKVEFWIRKWLSPYSLMRVYYAKKEIQTN